MWGLYQGNQGEICKWLEKEGFKITRARYQIMIAQLLSYPKIEEILRRLVIPTVRENFEKPTMDVLREHWNSGECPTIDKIKSLEVKGRGTPGVDRAFHWLPFIEINTQFHYVERWGELAGPWMVEIEPIIDEIIPAD